MIDIEEAINLIEYGLEVDGYNVIPNLKSFNVKDLFEVYSEKFGLKYTLGVPRISEKLHEIMVAEEEAPRTEFKKENNTLYMHYKNLTTNPLREEFSSKTQVVSKEQLENILESYNFFKP